MNEGNQETNAGTTPARCLGGLLSYRRTLTFEKMRLSPCALNTQVKNFRIKEKCGPRIRKSSSHQQKCVDQRETALKAGRLSVKR
ncbi:hypothetical protein [Methylobacterium soli]|uniref:Uncharacterized protein n=1 Tax=Methylobacterium soli TaxID=553447 RepID=A0A6L3T3N9_9HYPH|nr:hypothetical protein [Methylobacterium soli]KAB1081280.1 hypothetical protein F6X53_02945 [Methylobacterium soli]